MAINLLSSGYDLADIQSILEQCDHERVLPTHDSEVWRNLRYDAYFRPLIDLATQELEVSLPDLSDELYADFHKTGKRIRFESVYFERRRRLGRALIAYLRSAEGSAERTQFLQSILSKFEAIAHEVSWAVPAHVSEESGKDPLQIDLFGAETANLMAEILELFDPAIPVRLKQELRERLNLEIFDNFLNRHRDFWWTSTHNNWNAVCHQGVVGAALTQLDDLPKLAEILMLAGANLNRFLDGFMDDGGCSEGPAYWSYGFGWFAKLNAQLEARSRGMLSLFEGNSKIQKIARYGPLMTLPGGRVVNFSDCSSTLQLRPSLLTYLGARLGDPLCAGLGRHNYRKLVEQRIVLGNERSDFANFSNLLLFDPKADDASEDIDVPLSDVYFQDLNVILSHSKAGQSACWHFAAKGGHNDESHNHNDCGSYILNVGEQALIEEIGMPEYVKDYFDESLRYDFLAARTRGHSLAIINGVEQAAGVDFSSKIIEYEDRRESLYIRMDLTASYPEAASCAEFFRTFHFNKTEHALEVVDEFELTATSSLESAVITRQAIKVQGNRVVISSDGVSIVLVPGEGTELGQIEQFSYQDHSGDESRVSRISFQPKNLVSRSRISYRVISR